jgi:NAD(P)-dependent dehydrogenase (short-subunit alcohol dehydrogenase family)
MGMLDGKVALISGGARGQGACEARIFCEEGAQVVFGDILNQQGSALERELRASGLDATFVHLDVTNEAGWREAVAVAEREHGKLNVLVNNAGITMRTSIEETTEEDWDLIMAVNVKGVFLGTESAIPAIRRAGGGSIINISSAAGLVGSLTTGAAYTAAKGAVRLFTKATAIQHVKDNIRCNSVHPGPISTEMIRGLVADEAAWDQRLARLPMGRAGEPEEVAYGVLFLASDQSSYMTGSEVVIDGGTTAQ